MVCWNQMPRGAPGWFADTVYLRDGKFEMRGCDPKETYTVYFADPQKQLGATVQLSVKEAAGKPMTVRLSPCGKATARFVNKEGQPMAKFQPLLYFLVRPKDKELSADQDFAANVDRLNHGSVFADAQGRCTFPALIPGATYRVLGYNLNSIRDFTVRPGEDLQLGDIVVTRPE
jgi:hypothetical protein